MGTRSDARKKAMRRASRRLKGFGTTIFSEMTRLAVEHEAVNLGQGFPSEDGPDAVRRAAVEAIEQGRNQYCRMAGIPSLVEAVSEHQKRFWGLDYDAEHEITVMNGATEAIFVALQALCDPGDEVVIFEPFYDSYRASIAMAGAVERAVTLRPPDFSVDRSALAEAVSDKTKIILINTPHNPSGKVFDRETLEFIAALCREYDLTAVTDEVYEHLVYEGEHVSMAGLPGMRERTVTISSTGKTFSLTGWKVGYACAAPELTRALRTVHQFVTFCTAPPLQYAMATALRMNDGYFESLRETYRKRRDLLCEGLEELGLLVYPSASTYFVLTDIRPLGFDDDVAFCRMLPEKAGVAAIPPSAFYVHREEGRCMVRWAFCKSEHVITEGLARLRRYFRR